MFIYIYIYILGYSSESDNPSILLSISILLYFGVLIMNMIIADKAIFKVKTSKNSKIFKILLC